MPGGRHYDHEVGDAYRDQVAEYLDANFRRFGLEVFVEVEFGKTVIGKNRRLDLLVLRETDQKALGLECKFQSSSGTTDEKIPYALADLDAMWIEGALVYGGSGWSPGVQHTLQASRRAVRCEAGEDLARTKSTLELDHVVASVFGLWSLILPRSKMLRPNPQMELPSAGFSRAKSQNRRPRKKASGSS
jgi:hypothetical protein